jgi:hypothetical protein
MLQLQIHNHHKPDMCFRTSQPSRRQDFLGDAVSRTADGVGFVSQARPVPGGLLIVRHGERQTERRRVPSLCPLAGNYCFEPIISASSPSSIRQARILASIFGQTGPRLPKKGNVFLDRAVLAVTKMLHVGSLL